MVKLIVGTTEEITIPSIFAASSLLWENRFSITLDREVDPAKCTILLLDENHNLSPCLDAVISGSTITFANESNSAVALVKIAK